MTTTSTVMKSVGKLAMLAGKKHLSLVKFVSFDRIRVRPFYRFSARLIEAYITLLKSTTVNVGSFAICSF